MESLDVRHGKDHDCCISSNIDGAHDAIHNRSVPADLGVGGVPVGLERAADQKDLENVAHEPSANEGEDDPCGQFEGFGDKDAAVKEDVGGFAKEEAHRVEDLSGKEDLFREGDVKLAYCEFPRSGAFLRLLIAYLQHHLQILWRNISCVRSYAQFPICARTMKVDLA